MPTVFASVRLFREDVRYKEHEKNAYCNRRKNESGRNRANKKYAWRSSVFCRIYIRTFMPNTPADKAHNTKRCAKKGREFLPFAAFASQKTSAEETHRQKEKAKKQRQRVFDFTHRIYTCAFMAKNVHCIEQKNACCNRRKTRTGGRTQTKVCVASPVFAALAFARLCRIRPPTRRARQNSAQKKGREFLPFAAFASRKMYDVCVF